MKPVQIEHEGGNENQAEGIRQKCCPAEQEDQRTEIHGIAGQLIDPGGHEGGGRGGFQRVDGGPRDPERNDPGDRDADTDGGQSEGHGRAGGQGETSRGGRQRGQPHERGDDGQDNERWDFQFERGHGELSGRRNRERDLTTQRAEGRF